MITLTSFVSRPSLAPTVSTAQGSGSFRVAHRRVNQLGQFTALSPLALDRAFPMTITPQAYQDGDSLLRDEILISNDAGATWRRAHSGLISSPVTISAWSNSWQVVSIGDTQMPGSALDAGRFNPGSAPSFDIFLLTESSTFSTVSLRLWDTITGSQASMFAGLVQLVYRGQIASGTGALTSGSGVTIWQGSEASTASILVAGFANQVHKFELTFLGYPPSLPALSLGFELSINRTVYSIDLADDWAEGSLWLNPDKQFLWPPLKPTTTGGNVTVERFAIAGSGVALLNSGPITRTLANGTHWLSMSPTGEVSLASTVPAGNYPVAKAIVSENVLTRVFPACTFRALRLIGPAGAGLVPYRFINFSNGLLVPSAGTTGSTVRVSTNSTGAHVTSGFALVEAGEAILVGSNIQANSNGKAINESGIGLGVALSEAYADGDLILVQLITASEGGGAITAGEVRDALETLTGTNRLDASAIQNLPSIPTSAQIRDSLETLTGTDRLDASAISGITDALEALTGEDRLDSSAIKNLPGAPSGMQIRLALESLSSELRLNASAIQGLPEAPTSAQIRDSLETLTGTDRLDASAIQNLPQAPTALSELTNDTNFTTLADVANEGYLTSIPDNSVTTAKVQNGAITNSKLASGIDAAKITTGTIPNARLDTGTTANKIVQLDGSGRLPALDGSQLTNLPSGGAPIAVQNEGTPLTSQVTGFNFTGEGVTASNSGGLVTVNVPGGGGGGGVGAPTQLLANLEPIPLIYQSNGGASDLIHYLGTQGGTQTFVNPVTNGQLTIVSNSLGTSVNAITNQIINNNEFSNAVDGTVVYDLGSSRQFQLNRFLINCQVDGDLARVFVSYSNDLTNWTTVINNAEAGGSFQSIWTIHDVSLTPPARYWSVRVVRQNVFASFTEIQMYGQLTLTTFSATPILPAWNGKFVYNDLYQNNFQLTIPANNPSFTAGWACYIRNNNASAITVTPLLGVTLSTGDDAVLNQNEMGLLVCVGSNSWVFQKLSVQRAINELRLSRLLHSLFPFNGTGFSVVSPSISFFDDQLATKFSPLSKFGSRCLVNISEQTAGYNIFTNQWRLGNFNTNFTVAFWHFPVPASSNRMPIFTHYVSNAQDFPHFQVYADGRNENAQTTTRYRIATNFASSGDVDLYPSATYAINAWHLVIVRWNRATSTMSLTVDNNTNSVSGVINGFNEEAVAGRTANRVELFGSSNGGTANHTDRLDQLAFWYRALSDAECAALWNGGAGLEIN